MAQRIQALSFAAAEVELDWDYVQARRQDGSWFPAEGVDIYLGDQVIARIEGDDLVTSGECDIIIDETVAQWLTRILARASEPAR